ncbi:FliO/MopB family protein [Alicyclobacillus acidoterrestris]|uniref:Flagellar biosynthetic protein FliO n=1 Tax=Alicyclobacillus acidoterrestris (strain ATCC 49025 / DSM 3922 / CIP 106132 / NCIMB 13137 / GD3B) TaxID=1356854 RepID=T0C0V9_ALIAG|nr:flagellar biosynthetic protein FliO [Alicyclobacillus acidoterrestris]EPZ46250.1 hypothetical protein N007_07080 [Alicyclobacillus acidoterrestris ATCC 49025]UNO47116.1 flagellar biosynthetic protein FliO [Alicyclobacillus acidoterrestris]
MWNVIHPNLRIALDTTTNATAPVTVGAPGVHYYINVVIALVVVVLMIVLLVRFLAKRTNVQQRGAIQVLAARQLAPNRSVQVVEVGEKRFLIGVGEDVSLLAEVTDSYEQGVAEQDPSSFGQALSSALAELRRHPHRDE